MLQNATAVVEKYEKNEKETYGFVVVNPASGDGDLAQKKGRAKQRLG